MFHFSPESRLPQTLEDTYRVARALLKAKLEEFRHLPEMNAYITTRMALIQQVLAEHFPSVPCWVESHYTEYTNADERDLSMDAEMGFELCFAPHVSRYARWLVASAINEYLTTIDSQPDPDPESQEQKQSQPLCLLPQWCSSHAQ